MVQLKQSLIYTMKMDFQRLQHILSMKLVVKTTTQKRLFIINRSYKV